MTSRSLRWSFTVLAKRLRVSEVANLRLADVTTPTELFSAKESSVRIRPQGSHPERTIVLNAQTDLVLARYLGSRPAALTDAVFVSKFGTGLTTRAIRNIITKHATAAGIHHTSVSTLRHSRAAHALRHGTSLADVQAMLGHAARKATRRYLPIAHALTAQEHQATAR